MVNTKFRIVVTNSGMGGRRDGVGTPRSSEVMTMFYDVMRFILWASLILYLGHRFFLCMFHNK